MWVALVKNYPKSYNFLSFLRFTFPFVSSDVKSQLTEIFPHFGTSQVELKYAKFHSNSLLVPVFILGEGSA